MHVYMNFRKHELFDMQNLLFPIVFSILHKTPNATYIILFCMFRPTIFHFIIVFLIQLLAATPNEYILCLWPPSFMRAVILKHPQFNI